jgi:hypothetical protein
MRTRGQSIWSWFLGQAELARTSEAAQRFTAERREYLRRAKLAFEMGDLALSPGSAVRSGSGSPLASNLFRQSVYWALLSQGPPPSRGSAEAQPNPVVVWGAADPQLLLSLGAKESELLEVSAIIGSTFVELAAGSSEEQRARARLLQRFAKRLLAAIQRPLWALSWAKFKRLARVSLLAGLALGGFGLVALRLLSPPNLAKGKPWRTSSVYAECHPEKTECAGAITDILFHTNHEPEPWFEYDFGAPLAFSSLTVRNRVDYGLELSSPLVAEVSDDGKSYREVCRRVDPFTTWRPRFATQHARYLRLRVLRSSYFHLRSIEVYP